MRFGRNTGSLVLERGKKNKSYRRVILRALSKIKTKSITKEKKGMLNHVDLEMLQWVFSHTSEEEAINIA
jgi:hypothetical protein